MRRRPSLSLVGHELATDCVHCQPVRELASGWPASLELSVFPHNRLQIHSRPRFWAATSRETPARAPGSRSGLPQAS